MSGLIELPMAPPGPAASGPREDAAPEGDRRFRVDGMDCAACAQTVQLDNRERRGHGYIPADSDDPAQKAGASGQLLPGPEALAAQHMRLDLVSQIPERPRRFLLRLALGYTYDEIGAAEDATYSTVNKQIARAKRLLRDLEQAAAGQAE